MTTAADHVLAALVNDVCPAAPCWPWPATCEEIRAARKAPAALIDALVDDVVPRRHTLLADDELAELLAELHLTPRWAVA